MPLASLTFLLLFLVVTVLALVRPPMWGLVLYVAIFFLHPPSRWWGAYLPNLRWAFIAAIIAMFSSILYLLSQRNQKHNSFVNWSVVAHILFVVIMWVQVPTALDSDAHIYGTVLMTKYIVVMYMIIKFVDTPARLRALIATIITGCLYFGYLASVAAASSARVDGVGGPGVDDASSLGMVLTCGVLLSGSLYFGSTGALRWLSVLALPLSLNGMVAAGSRGAFLALLTGALTVVCFRPAGQLRKVVAYGALGIGLFLVLGSTHFWERMQTLKAATDTTMEFDHSAFGRIEIAKAQIQMFKDNPFGVGHKGTTALSYTYIDPIYHATGGGRSSHNTPLSALVNHGFAGLALWVFIVVATLWTLWRTRRALLEPASTPLAWLNAGIAGSFVALLTAGMFSPQIIAEVYYWLIAMAVATHAMIQRPPAPEQEPAEQSPEPHHVRRLEREHKQIQQYP